MIRSLTSKMLGIDGHVGYDDQVFTRFKVQVIGHFTAAAMKEPRREE